MKKQRLQKRPSRARLSDFAKRLEVEWKRLTLPAADVTALVGVSGGADSTALLLALDELNRAGRFSVKIVVAHLDHRLRKASKEDAEWVRQLSEKLGYRSLIFVSNVQKRARESADNLEQSARRARYEFFGEAALAEKAQLILTAHTLDDQAETILMRLLRGSAAEGLGGIESLRKLEAGSEIQLVRPLLSWSRRSDTEQYCRSRRIRFRVDEMNDDERFVRVRVRKQLLPLLRSYNNRIVEALARTATLLREDAAALSEAADHLLEQAMGGRSGVRAGIRPLKVDILIKAPSAIRRRALRQWIADSVGHLRRLEMVHLTAVDSLLDGNRGRTIELPNGLRISRQKGWLYLSFKKVEKGSRDL